MEVTKLADQLAVEGEGKWSVKDSHLLKNTEKQTHKHENVNSVLDHELLLRHNSKDSNTSQNASGYSQIHSLLFTGIY